jgi:hypothetical protein
VLMGIADDLEGQARIAVFQQALQVLDWSEGRNVQFVYRWSGGDVAHARQFHRAARLALGCQDSQGTRA